MKKFCVYLLIVPCLITIISCKNTDKLFIYTSTNYELKGLHINPNYIPSDSDDCIYVYDNYKKNIGYTPKDTNTMVYSSFKNSGFIKSITFHGKGQDSREMGSPYISKKAFTNCDSIEQINFYSFPFFTKNESIKTADNFYYATSWACNQLRNLKEFQVQFPISEINSIVLKTQSVRENFLCSDWYYKTEENANIESYELSLIYYIAYPMGLGNRITITSTTPGWISLDMFQNCFYSKIYLTIPSNVKITGYAYNSRPIPSSVMVDKTEVFITIY